MTLVDSSGKVCTDHVVAYKVRTALGMGSVPGGLDRLLQDMTNGASAGGFGHGRWVCRLLGLLSHCGRELGPAAGDARCHARQRQSPVLHRRCAAPRGKICVVYNHYLDTRVDPAYDAALEAEQTLVSFSESPVNMSMQWLRFGKSQHLVRDHRLLRWYPDH